MRFYWLTHLMRTGLMLPLASAFLIPPVAHADQPRTEILVAELAEDESVEDVEHSTPRQETHTGDTDRKAQDEKPSNTSEPEDKDEPPPEVSGEPPVKDDPPAKIVAPNIDLKEVAPVPEPVTVDESEKDAPAPESPETPESVAEEPQPELRPEPHQDDQTEEAEEPEVAEAPPVAETPESTAAAAEKEEVKEPTPSFKLLGAEVLPGTSTRLAWSPAIQIAGLSQPTPVLVVNGIDPGPTLCLTGAVHGDELNGIEIIRRTMYDLNPEKLAGRVVGIPIVNLPGFQQASRYLPDRRDLNRHFPGSPVGSLADRIAHSLFENVIRYCDMLVDIHTGSLKRTNLPQLRADMNVPEVARFTRGFDRMAVVHSTGSPGMLRTAAVAAGVRAVTMEAGESHRIQEHQIDAGVNSITSLMDREGMISRMFVWGDPEPVYYDSNWIRAEHGGILFSEIKLGAKVSEGQILGYVADPITNAQHAIRATGKGRIIGMAVDQVVMAGFAAYHVGTEAEVPGE